MTDAPPHWAEALLALAVRRRDFESVSGDLLEEYRDTMLPRRGRRRANRWYAAQVFGFVWRSAYVWALLLAASFIARTALDWLLPSPAFHTRAAISTTLAAAILLAAGWWAAWRSGSLVAGAVAGAATAAIAALVSVAGAAALLLVWHDPVTMMAIQASGGLTEVFVLPFMMVLPAALIGTMAGTASVVTRRLVVRA